MRIKGMQLENFRGFKDASIEIKPLTVLLGANSSGKSSFGHALAAMSHAQWLQGNSNRATLTPGQNDSDEWPVDLGLLEDLRHHGASGPVYVGLDTSEGQVKWGFGLDPSNPDKNNLSVSSVELPGGLDSVLTGQGHAEAQITLAQPIAASGSISIGISTFPNKQNSVVYKRSDPVQWQDEKSGEIVRVNFDGLVVNAIQHLTGTAVSLNNIARNEILATLRHLTYMRAIRNRPFRYYKSAKSSVRQSIGYSGEWTAHFLHERVQDSVSLYRPPDASQFDSKEPIKARTIWHESKETLAAAIQFWLRHLGLASSLSVVRSDRGESTLQLQACLLEGQPHDITEVGFGLSQVLPVIIAGLTQSTDSMFVIDLPEAHLHPKPQAELADFFCSLALTGKTALVETHSDMFINQLRLRTAITPELLDKIAIYFIDSPDSNGCCSQPRRIGLDFDDELKWPRGFMQEGWELETKVSAWRRAWREAGQ